MTDRTKKIILFITASVVLLTFAVCPYFAGRKPAPAPKPQPAPEVTAELLGYEPQPEATAAFVATLPAQTLPEAGPDLFRGEKIETFLYRSLYKAHEKRFGKPWQVGKQGIGDCVSWGWAHAVDIQLAIDWELGESAEWKPAATESIYGGSRVEARGRSSGGYSDGSYGGAAAKWVRDWGVIFREPYLNGSINLTEYSSSRAKSWGNFGNGGQGDGGKLDAIAKQHPIRTVTLVRNFEEAATAIQAGYPVPVCSGVGFNPMWGKVRDADGFARRSGGWGHCMCFIGVRYGARPGLLCLNSWGPKWVTGPKYPDDQPDGSFWVDASVCDSMLSGKDSFAISGVEGFPYRDLRHGDWVQLTPRKPADNEEPLYVLVP